MTSYEASTLSYNLENKHLKLRYLPNRNHINIKILNIICRFCKKVNCFRSSFGIGKVKNSLIRLF